MTLFYTSLHQMIFLFILIGIGYVCKKKRFLPDGTDGSIATLENNILMPAIILNTFISQCTMENMVQKMNVFLAGTVVLAITIVIATLLSKVFSKDNYVQNIYKYSFSFPNIGFMGIAVVQGIGGADLLFDYMIFTLPYNIFIYSIGVTWLMPQDKKSGFQVKSLLNPMFASMLLGMVIGLAGIPLPTEVSRTISSLSACMSPLAMILTGYIIAKFEISYLLKINKVYIASAIRLVAFPLCAYVIMKVLKIPDVIILPTVVTLAMPMGLNTIVIPTAHGLEVNLGASMALISSLAAVVSIPLVFMLVL